MDAILFKKGVYARIYILQDDAGKSEVKGFFERGLRNKRIAGYIRGFVHLIEVIAAEGTMRLTAEQYETWDINGTKFGELKREQHRLSIFAYENGKRFILASHFEKKNWKENKEYRRAIGLKSRFDANPTWRE